MNESMTEIINTSSQDDSIYLVSKLSNDAGFFAHKGKLVYMVRDLEKLGYESIETELISLKSHVYILAVENHPQFASDYYNILMYKGEQEGANFDGFITLCKTYCNSTVRFGFIKFFYSLVDLFQLPKEQQFKNLLGLYGELKFIEHIYSIFKCDLSSMWHKGNAYDRYDFTCIKNNFEIKSIITEETIVKIKHSQIFNNDSNYLVVVKLQNHNSGTTLNNFINNIRNQVPFINNYQFQLRIEQERKRISLHDANTVKLNLVSIEAYKVSNLETIKDIPESITSLSYKYNFNGVQSNELKKSLFI